MKNVYGNALTLTLFGESHGSSIGAVLDGLSPGIPVDEAHIARELTRRRPQGQTATARVEQDPFVIESGVFNGCTTGTPLCIRIPNAGQHSGDYAGMQDCARPGHSDYPAFCKYHGYSDYRGGGHFSGRITAALVAAGAIAEGALRGRGIRIGTHLSACAGVQDRPFRQTDGQIPDGELDALREPGFPVLDRAAGERMQQAILAAKADGDSVGGVTETAVTGLCAGLGEPWLIRWRECWRTGCFRFRQSGAWSSATALRLPECAGVPPTIPTGSPRPARSSRSATAAAASAAASPTECRWCSAVPSSRLRPSHCRRTAWTLSGART